MEAEAEAEEDAVQPFDGLCRATTGCTRRAPPPKWWGRPHIWEAMPSELVPRLKVSCERCAAAVIERFCEEEGFQRCRTKSCFRFHFRGNDGPSREGQRQRRRTWICAPCAERQRARQRTLWRKAETENKCAHCSARLPDAGAAKKKAKKCEQCLARSREVDRRRRERRMQRGTK